MSPTATESPVLDEREVLEDVAIDLGGVPPGLPPDPWDDRPPPREPEWRPSLGNARLAMLMFLGTEAVFFAGFIGAFLVLRLSAPVWPPPAQPRLPVEVTGINTAILLASGYTMVRALRAVRRGDQAGLLTGLGQTALLGAAFLGVQGYEWARLLSFGLTVTSGAYGGTFYTLIGLHGVHVLGALAWLLITLARARQGRFTPRQHAGATLCGMYWCFVVGLWPILYLLVYLA